ncbi:hypothetical protein MVG78_10010 [Roseomonas gilardii subsp. gilardii]|uniref:hypothetical protein n=1 Tax=Roseomonas gilardii TaxID=257708 RepID=UPI001FFB5DF1|nr:hypothetical protein [Roseomonas gilardii]UPG70965.1 hypothetical protein MVG78_10010 [Roseomonas gilardii subsp. gilardii]
MINTRFAVRALGMALGGAPALLPMMAQAQVPTTQYSPGSTPRNDSRSNPGAPDVAPNPDEPVSHAQQGATPRNDSRSNPGAPDVPPNPNEPVSHAQQGATPRNDSRSADSARGGPGTGPVHHRSGRAARQPQAPASHAPAMPAAQQSGVVIGGPEASRSSGNPDGAFLGGGGVFERAPDGSLRQVSQ